jgi:hypothetical protein
MTSENKRDFWQRHMEGWHQSTLSQKTYCQQQALSFASFGYWRTRLNRKTDTPGKFIPVNLTGTPTSVKVFLPTGVRLELPAHVLAEVLPVIVHSVQETS